MSHTERCGAPRRTASRRRCLAALGVAALLLVPAASVAAGADLPPRPVLPPTPVPEVTVVPRGRCGGSIRLEVTMPEGRPAPQDLWTVVQWEDAAGAWHDVDGWRGAPDDAGGRTKTWWVSANDLGRGPSRWVVQRGIDGPVVALSEPFHLPAAPREVVAVSASLP